MSRSNADAFAKGLVPLPKRLGLVTIKPWFYSLVLVANGARISRPGAPVFNRTMTLKDTWAKVQARG